MKHKYIILTVCLIAAISCSDFLEKIPANEISEEVFFESESDLELYANGLLNSALPAFGDITTGEDLYTDFCGTRTSKQLYWGDYSAAKANNWTTGTWSFLRRVAYMLENMPRCKDNVSAEKYNHYEGIARFWRAYRTVHLIKIFGDVYFVDKVIQPEDEKLLYGPREDREYIFHRVREDLEFACKNCLASGANIHTASRVYVNKYVALAYASRYFLYEGTYRKYHSVNPSTGKPWNGEYESADELLALAEKYSKDLIESKAFSIHKDYRSLFISEDIRSDEVIWGRSVSRELGVQHSAAYSYCSTTSSQSYSPTKEFVRMFLKTDGSTADEAVSITKEFEGRDARLSAYLLSPGEKWTRLSGAKEEFPLNWTWTQTGYVWIKWVYLEEETILSGGKSYYSIPIYRYAEVLLNYAEAAAELGHMTKDIWDMTVGALRTRAGVASIYPEDAGYIADTWLREYYTQDVLHPAALSDVILEIRRERATELTLEGSSHYDDLIRWCLGDLIERRYKHQGWRGIYLTPDEAYNGFTWAGKKYTVSTSKNTSETNYRISGTDSGNWSLTEGTYGYLVYHYDMVWDDMMYTRPIPIAATNTNPNLGQNEGWQWL